jgi:Zn-dependent protease
MFHFRLGSFPVTVSLAFFLVALLIKGGGFGDLGWQAAVWVLVVFISVLVHELGHAVVARAFGGKPEIRLEAFGGVTFPQFPKRPTPGRQFLLSVAGPVAGLLLGAAAWALGTLSPPDRGSPSALLISYFVTTSVVWAIFNLLPILPLDGGQMMLAVLEGVRKKPSVTLASWLSVVACAVVAVAVWQLLGFQIWILLWIGLFAWQNLVRARTTGPGPQQQQAAPIDPVAELEVNRAGNEAREAVVNGDFEKALDAATRLENGGGPYRQAAGLRLRAGIELARRDNETAAMLAGQSYSIFPSAEAAVVAARANLRASEQERARNWLRRAFEAGASPAAVRQDPELGPLAAP